MSFSQPHHLDMRKPLSRKQGRSVVAKAAYNAREDICDEKTGEVKKHSRNKHEVEFKGIFVDTQQKQVPAWTGDRPMLWNAVEAGENRKDSQLAQEMIGALPHQLSAEGRANVVKDFTREFVRGTGRIADAAIHKPPAKGDDRNFHAHILFTMRGIGPDGFEGKKLPVITEQDIERLSEKFAKRAARELRREGFELEADRWTVAHLPKPEQRKDAERRGDLEHAVWCDLEPTKHRGPEATAIDRKAAEGKGEPSYLGTIERERKAAEAETMKLRREMAQVGQLIASIEQDVIRDEIDRERQAAKPPLIRMYRGIGKNVAPEGGRAFFSTDLARAAAFGKLHYVDITPDELVTKFERPHSKRILEAEPIAGNDWRTADGDIIARLKPLEDERQAPKETAQAAKPQAPAKEQPAAATAKAEKPLSRDAGSIRMAFTLTQSPQGFADALEDRGMILAQVTKHDIERDRARTAPASQPVKDGPRPWMEHTSGYDGLSDEHKTVAQQSYAEWKDHFEARQKSNPEKAFKPFSLHQYVGYVQDKHSDNPRQAKQPPTALERAAGGLAVVTLWGDVHPLTPKNTGMERKELESYLAQIDRRPLPTVTAAREVMGEVYRHRQEEKRTETNDKHWPIAPPREDTYEAGQTLPAYRFGDAARQATAHRPAATMPAGLRGTSVQIWEAYNAHEFTGGDTRKFVEKLSDKGIRLAVVSKGEAEQSQREAVFAKEIGTYAPIYRAGEFVAVNRDGDVYKFNKRNTGAEPQDVQRDLMKGDLHAIQSLDTVKAIVKSEMSERDLKRVERSQQIAAARMERATNLGRIPQDLGRIKTVAGRATVATAKEGLKVAGAAAGSIRSIIKPPKPIRAVGRSLSKALDLVGGMVESLAAPPKPMSHAEIKEAERRHDAAARDAEKEAGHEAYNAEHETIARRQHEQARQQQVEREQRERFTADRGGRER